MKVIILLAGYGTRMRPHTWSRPKPLLKVAGNTVVGHLLDLMAPITSDEVIFVVGYRGEQIEAWIRERYPHLDARFVVQEDAKGQAHAVWLCRDYLDEQQVVVAFGDGIIEADYPALPDPAADGVLMVKEVEDPRRFGVAALDEKGFVRQLIEKPAGDEHRLALAGVNWFRDGRQLCAALDHVIEEGRQTLGEHFLADALQVMLEAGARLRTQEVITWVDAGTPQALLQTNARLLSAGYASDEALERSFVDGFTVVPPVYIHPSAQIDAAVIGPYASIDAEVEISNAVVRNSIIDTGAQVRDCVLQGALVGVRAQVSGRGVSLFVGDDSWVELG
ncbi:MAG: sugar phosphate nucleotidyltransferase [Candidatus Promineifilaceae bacterium]